MAFALGVVACMFLPVLHLGAQTPLFCRSLAIRYAAWKTKASGCEFAIACAFVVAALAFSLTVAPELWSIAAPLGSSVLASVIGF